MHIGKTVKTSLCLALAVLLLLAGCAESGATEATSSTSSTAGAPAAASPEAAPAADGEPVELTLYTYWIPATNIQSYEEVAGLQELERLANVNITWQSPAVGQNELEAFNIMMASGEYPDIIQHRWTDYPGGVQKLVADGVIQSLEPYFAEGKAADYKAIIDSNEDLWRQASLSDGTIAHFTTIEVLKRAAYEGLALRKDWLDKTGLAVPTTVDEFYAVLKAFKEADPNIIPYTSSKPVNNGIKGLFAPFGIIGWDMQLNEAGEVVYGPNEPGFRDALATLQQWYAEGLIDSECFSIDQTTHDAKVSNGEAVGGLFSVSGVTTYKTYGGAENPDFDFVPVPFLKNGPDGKPYVHNRERVMYSGRRGAAISSTCADVDAALRFLNSFYAPETKDLAIWGIEGESYTVEADGSKKYTDLITKDPEWPPIQALNKFAIPVWGWFKEFDIEAAYGIDMNTPLAVESNELYAQGDLSLCLPVIQLPPEEAVEYGEIMNEVTTFVEESVINFIIGTQSMDAYDGYLSTLEGMDLARAIEIQQAAYASYQGKTR